MLLLFSKKIILEGLYQLFFVVVNSNLSTKFAKCLVTFQIAVQSPALVGYCCVPYSNCSLCLVIAILIILKINPIPYLHLIKI